MRRTNSKPETGLSCGRRMRKRNHSATGSRSSPGTWCARRRSDKRRSNWKINRPPLMLPSNASASPFWMSLRGRLRCLAGMLGDGRLHRPTLVLQQCALSTIADIRSLEDHAAMARSVIAALLLNVCIGADLLCAPAGATTNSGTSIELFNPGASRRIPLRLYHPGSRRALAVLLPGVGAQPGDYSFLAKYLARRGFAVAEVRLELPGDSPIATGGNIAALRAPELRSGVNTVRYTIGQLDRLRYASATRPVVLVGHSNGGDVAMLFGSEYPAEVGVIFSLDNLRVAI